MGKLSVDDPGWFALIAAIELRQQQTVDIRLAIVDLERKMASRRKLRSMRRYLTGECELKSASFWEGHVIEYPAPSALNVTIYRRTAIDDTPQRWSMFAHHLTSRIALNTCSMFGDRTSTGCIPRQSAG